MYKEFIIIFSIIIIHELGHLSCSKVFKWNIDKIEIYPFGGCVKFNEKINRPLYEELLILLSGPLAQMLYFLLIVILYNNNILSERNYLLFKSYHYLLLIFNLLPIYPLDGGKLINILSNYIFPYKKSNILIIILSFVLSIILVINTKNINFITMLMLLCYESFIYLRKQKYIYNKFLLERYLENFNFKKTKIIKNKNNLYKNKKHIIKIDNKYITEKEYLKRRFGVYK